MGKRALPLGVVLVISLLFCNGCSTLTVTDVGRGMQVGSVGGSNWLAPLVWSTGFVLELVGKAVDSGQTAATDTILPVLPPDPDQTASGTPSNNQATETPLPLQQE